MTICPSPGELQAYADGELAAREAAQTGRHIEGCSKCQLIIAEIEESDRLIGRWLCLEEIPAAPGFQAPVAVKQTRLNWLWLGGVVLAALVGYYAWQQIGYAFWLHNHLWMAVRSVLENAFTWLLTQLPLLMVKLAASSLWNDTLRMQGIVQGVVIIALIGFIRWFRPKIPVRRQYI